MRNISAKTDNVGDTLPASDFNANLRSELQNVVTSAGLTLDPEGGPDTDVEMLGKAMAMYGTAAQFYQDSGAANAYVLARVGNLKALTSYIDGLTATFKAGNSNTGASTVNIDSLGSKSIVNSFGNALTGDEIKGDEYTTIRYHSSNDNFEIVSEKLFSAINVYTSSDTWTKPDGLKFVTVWVVGGGGGGGGIASDANAHAGTGGGGGGASFKVILESALSSSETVTIGAGGTGGTNVGGSGSAGGTSSFGSHCSATGGDGGNGDATGTSTYPNDFYISPIVSGGVGSSGDINLSGQTGMFGRALASNRTTLSNGGSAPGPFGGKPTLDFLTGAQADGYDGNIYGGGGGGAASDAAGTTGVGGDGADGVVVVQEFF